MTLIALMAHPDLFLSQAQVVAPWYQEALFLAQDHESLELWGLEPPVTHPFAD